MNDRNQLIAYLATLGALVLVVVCALAFGAFSQHVIDKIEAFGIGTVTGGLIGVLRIPQRTTAEKPATDPATGAQS